MPTPSETAKAFDQLRLKLDLEASRRKRVEFDLRECAAERDAIERRLYEFADRITVLEEEKRKAPAPSCAVEDTLRAAYKQKSELVAAELDLVRRNATLEVRRLTLLQRDVELDRSACRQELETARRRLGDLLRERERGLIVERRYVLRPGEIRIPPSERRM